MVNNSTFIAVCVTLFISLILPVIIYIAYGIKNRGSGIWSAWFIGAMGFVIMQMCIRIPLLNFLASVTPLAAFSANHFVLYYFILAFTAALFEIIARYAAARILNDNVRLTPQKGIAAGLGHGGIESMLLIGMTYISNIIYIFMINSGAFDTALEQASASGTDITSLVAIRDSLINTGSGMFYLAGYERLLTMIIHLALSFLVCYGVWKGTSKRSLLVAFVIHWALDFIGPILGALATPYLGSLLSQNAAYILTYLFMTGMAAFAIAILIKVFKQWKRETVISQK